MHKRHGGCGSSRAVSWLSTRTTLPAASRELDEELKLRVESIGPILFERQDPGSEFLIQSIEVTTTGEPQAVEHDAVAWVLQSELLEYELAPTDRVFAIHLLNHHA